MVPSRLFETRCSCKYTNFIVVILVNQAAPSVNAVVLPYLKSCCFPLLPIEHIILGTRREYHEYLFQDNLNRSRGAIASGADHYFQRHGQKKRSVSTPKRQSRRLHNKYCTNIYHCYARDYPNPSTVLIRFFGLFCGLIRYASVRSVNDTVTTTTIEVRSKQLLRREEKWKNHEKKYPPPMDVSSDRAFELVSSLPQANEVRVYC